MTIGIGLLVDTLIVRSFMTPSIAAALGRWFWWPLNTFKIVKERRPRAGIRREHRADFTAGDGCELPIFQAGNSVVIAGSEHMTEQGIETAPAHRRAPGPVTRSRDPQRRLGRPGGVRLRRHQHERHRRTRRCRQSRDLPPVVLEGSVDHRRTRVLAARPDERRSPPTPAASQAISNSSSNARPATTTT